MSASQPGNIFACNPATARLTSTKLGCDPKGEKVVYVNGRTVVVSSCTALCIREDSDAIAIFAMLLDPGSDRESLLCARRYSRAYHVVAISVR